MLKNDGELEVQELDANSLNLPAGELVLGELYGFDSNGQPLVTFHLEKSYGPVNALATVPLTPQQIGRQVGLLFAQNGERTPVVVGLIHNAFHSILDNLDIAARSEDEVLFEPSETVSQDKSVAKLDELCVDGKKFVIEGKEEIVLRCGESSISLHKNGKISIRGKYLLNRSSGVNRIMGGSVQVN